MLRLASGLSSLTNRWATSCKKTGHSSQTQQGSLRVREGWRGSYGLGPGAALDSLARSKLSGGESNTCQIGWTGNRVTKPRKTPKR